MVSMKPVLVSAISVILAFSPEVVAAQSGPEISNPFGRSNHGNTVDDRSLAVQAEADRWIREIDCKITQVSENISSIQSELRALNSRGEKVRAQHGDLLLRQSELNRYLEDIQSVIIQLREGTLPRNSIPIITKNITSRLNMIQNIAETYKNLSAMAANRQYENELREISGAFWRARDEIGSLTEALSILSDRREEGIERYESIGAVFQRGWYGLECAGLSGFDGVYANNFRIQGRTFSFLGPRGYATAHGGMCGNQSQGVQYYGNERAYIEWETVCPDGYVMSRGTIDLRKTTTGFEAKECMYIDLDIPIAPCNKFRKIRRTAD